MNKNYRYRCQGVTLIEILLVVGLLVILASFASPSISNATTRTEMKAEAENIRYSIRIARNTARMNESNVRMNIHAEPGDKIHRISFIVFDDATQNMGLQEYQLDGDFLLTSDYASYEFDGRGMVNKPGVIILAARDDESVTTSFEVE